MMTLVEINKELFSNLDLYGNVVLFQTLKNRFDFVSMNNNSIPCPGSKTVKVEQMKVENFENVEILKTIFHKNGNITIKTREHGFLMFWR